MTDLLEEGTGIGLYTRAVQIKDLYSTCIEGVSA